ncbi:MAG: hypothetical protein JWM12_990 [Ilumatobacteraceae bacterium]|nr:hypothetical protein [Ilumatobacteraceae bacterium]
MATNTSHSVTLKPYVKIMKWWMSAYMLSSMRARGRGVTYLSWMRYMPPGMRSRIWPTSFMLSRTSFRRMA